MSKMNCTARLVLVTCLAVSMPRPALGQVCQGAPPLRNHSPRLSGELGLGVDATRVEIGVAAGRGAVFGSAGAGRYGSHTLDLFVVAAIGRIGVERSLTTRVAVCPSFEFSYGRYGGEHFDGTTLTQWAGGGGMSIGVTAIERPSFSVVPTVGVKVVTARYTGSAVGLHAREGITFSLAQIGIGLTRGRVGVLPAVAIPIGLSLRDTALVIAVSAPLP